MFEILADSEVLPVRASLWWRALRAVAVYLIERIL